MLTRATVSVVVAVAGLGLVTGCGSAGPSTLKQRDVVLEFASSDVPVPHCMPELGTRVIECADHALIQFPDARLLDVEIFPSVNLAQSVMRTGGNLIDKEGRPIRPFARVANVVVSLVAKPNSEQRRAILRALGGLRERLRR